MDSSFVFQLISLFLFAYFLGAIPFSLLFSKFKGIDLTKEGSGNLGATNVYRVLGLKYALIVFIMDILKGMVPAFFALIITQNPIFHLLVGFTAIIGHSLSCFVRFKGGKGVATGVGVLFTINPWVTVPLVVLSIIIIKITSYVAPVTLAACILLPILLFLVGESFEYLIFVSLICLFIVFRHKSNIIRIIKRQEHKI